MAPKLWHIRSGSTLGTRLGTIRRICAPSRSRCAITQPLLVVAGTADEAFYTEKYESIISQYAEVQVVLLDGVTHMGAVVDPVVRPVVKAWLENPGE